MAESTDLETLVYSNASQRPRDNKEGTKKRRPRLRSWVKKKKIQDKVKNK